MKNIIYALAVISSVVVLSACDNQEKKIDNFSGHWKAVNKSDGGALHPKFSSTMDITCSEVVCHIVNTKKTVLSDDELISNTDWNIKDSTTLMKGNGISSIYSKNNQLIVSDIIYERKKE